MITLDTNVVIAYLGGDKHAASQLEAALAHGEQLAVPTVVVAEILAYPHLDESTTDRTREWLETVTVISLDFENAVSAADLRRTTKLKLIDCIVAAVALGNGGALATRDHDFQKIPRLMVLDW